MTKPRTFFICLAALLCCATSRAQPSLRASLRGHVETLAADRLAGRETGSVGGLAAAHYIAGVLAAAGCEPAGDDGGWFQQTDVRRQLLSAPAELLLLDGAGGEHPQGYGSQWQIMSAGPVSGTFDLVIVGDGQELPVVPGSGRALVLATQLSQAFAWIRGGRTEGWPVVLLVGPATAGQPRPEPAALIAGSAARAQIFLRGNAVPGFASGRWQRLRLNLEVATASPAYNVVGRLPGVGTAVRPSLAEQAVVVSAHYDHIGSGHEGSSADDDEIFNGADDDASGVAAVLELARLAGSHPPPARTLLFLAVTGEEHGLLGTDFYLDHPVVPLGQTAYNLNFEMIGRPDPLIGGPGRLWLTGFELSNVGPELASRGLAVLADPRPAQSFFERSDNYAFVQRGVVAQTLSSYNLHDDYHRPSDEADRLDYEHMAEVVTVAWDVLQLLASGEIDPLWEDEAALGGVPPGGH